jgi:hypothetical protein
VPLAAPKVLRYDRSNAGQITSYPVTLQSADSKYMLMKTLTCGLPGWLPVMLEISHSCLCMCVVYESVSGAGDLILW